MPIRGEVWSRDGRLLSLTRHPTVVAFDCHSGTEVSFKTRKTAESSVSLKFDARRIRSGVCHCRFIRYLGIPLFELS